MKVFTKQQKDNLYIEQIKLHIHANHTLIWERYVQLGSKNVRLLCYSKDFIPLIQKQLSYTLKDSSDEFDATIVLWQENNPEIFLNKFIDERAKLRIAKEQESQKSEDISFVTVDKSNPESEILTRIIFSKTTTKSFEVVSQKHSIIKINCTAEIINAFDDKNNIYYYGVKNLHPEEFIKQGHIFVQIFNKITKTPNSHLVHGAVVGLNNKGILICARGQRGKSTLAVLSMMQGFEYVADDYLILEKENDELYSYPIYSIITLSPRMYNELYDDLKGKFVSNNARRDKYVIDIKAYHDTFRNKYPIKACIFPQIVDDEKPSIVLCKKGQAITQLIHSTINQMDDNQDIKSVQKLISFTKNFKFYQINLCSDIRKNVELLKQFCSQIN